MNRFVIRAASAAAALVALVACENPSSPTASEEQGPTTAALSTTTDGRKVTCPGKSGGVCDMSVSVVMTPSGRATLIVRTGGYDQATGTHDPNGTFEKIQYKIFDARGKLIATKNDDADGTVYLTRLPGTFTVEYRVEVQANIRNHSGKKGMAVVRGVATPAFLPDIDLSAESIELLVNGERRPLTTVAAGSPNTYIVDFANTKPVGGVPPTIGIRTLCVVSVDGVPQVPGHGAFGFSYVGSATQYIGPGQTGTCSFSLTLGAGEHTIKVTAVAADMFFESDTTNNSVTGTVRAGPPADVAVTSLARIVDGSPVTPLGEVTAGGTHSFSATVSSPAGALDAAVWCSVLIDGVAATPDRIQWARSQFTLAGGATNSCDFALTFPESGTFTIKVIAAAANDPNPANDSREDALLVKPSAPSDVTTDLVVREVSPLTAVLAGSGPVSYTAKVGVIPGGSESSAAFTCSVTTLPAAAVTMLPVSGPATTTSDAECRFTIDGYSASGPADAVYQIKVSVTPTAANELAPANNALTVAQVVKPRTVDLVVKSLRRDSGAGLVTIDTVPAGITSSYVALIGALGNTGATVTSAPATCSALVTNLTTNVSQSVPGTVTGTASTTTDATCVFPLTLAGNGDLDQSYSIAVTAQPVGVAENPATTANNTLVATQKAIVRVDIGIAIAGIQMFVDGVERATKDTISLGKTADFIANFQNFSSRDATVKCEVWTNPPGGTPVPLTVATPIISIPAGAVVQCPFSYTFAENVVVQFTATATSIQPLDNTPDNNSGSFTITPRSNLAFPELDRSNVDAQEDGLQNAGGVPTRITQQRAGISRVILAFTNRTNVIGDFVLTVKASSNGQQFSAGVLTAPGLTPGGLGAPNCVAGVDAGTAQTLNGLDVRMEICAEEAPGQPTIQAISVNYASGLSIAPIENAAGLFGFGSTIAFDLQLQWRLFGSTAPGMDQATGLLEFDLQKRVLDEFGNYRKTPNGVVRIVRNGP
jgi:hypothetical protein